MKLLERLPAPILDRIIRRQAAIHQTPLDLYQVSVARKTEEYEDAFRLLHIAYVYQGIENVRSSKLRITPQHVLPEATVLNVYERDLCVGTLTATLDSPAGIPLENDYKEEIERFRGQKARLMEIGSLAVVRRCWHSGVTNLLNLAAFHWSYNILHATHFVIGINPKAAPWYRALFGFKMLGSPRRHSKLVAPVVGLVLDLKQGVEHVRRCFPKPMSSGLIFADYLTGALPPCVQIPANVPPNELVRWKLPRDVFQELFIEKSDRLDSLDPVTLEYLNRWRSEATLGRQSSDS